MAFQYKIRAGTGEDISFLWEMLYEAIYVPEGEKKPSRNILQQPGIAAFLDEWGRRGDVAFIAEDRRGKPVGAIWVRHFDETNKTYGFIDMNTPVVSCLAVLSEYKGNGIGTVLLNEMIKKVKGVGVSSLSLSVDQRNPAVRLYERHGFKKVAADGTAWNMQKDFH